MYMKQFEKELKALANKRRLTLVAYLKNTEPMCVIDLAEAINLPFRTTSKHLSILFRVGILTQQQVGKEMQYSIDPNISKLSKSVIGFL